MNTFYYGSSPAEGSSKRPLWTQYGGMYREVDISQPWQPSPRSSTLLPIPNAPVYEISLHNSQSSPAPVTPARSEESALTNFVSVEYLPAPQVRTAAAAATTGATDPTIVRTNSRRSSGGPGRISTWAKWAKSVVRWLNSSSSKRSETTTEVTSPLPTVSTVEKNVSSVAPAPSISIPVTPTKIASKTANPFDGQVFDRVQPHEWKEWAYYARPRINGVRVYNTLSPYVGSYPLMDYRPQWIQGSNLSPEDVLRSIVDPDGTAHPERWKLGTTHPSLPPRPQRWGHPDPTRPLPFPWEVQLNPFLEHLLFGVPRMYWDIRDRTCACYGIQDNPGLMYLTPEDLSQPASYPFLTHMYVNGLADDNAERFYWPFMIMNPEGIKIQDVINSIFYNFQEYIFESEFWKWGLTRRKEATLARNKRCDPENPNNTGKVVIRGDPMRRIDYLGEKVLFRGLAPNPDATGWVLYLGQD